MRRFRIVAVSGSLRAQSSNAALLRAAVRAAPESLDVVVYEGVGGLPHFNPDLDAEGAIPPAPVAEWRALLRSADGMIISCPEYAHGLPGAFKNALDWLVSTADTLSGKPVALFNASAGGGDHAQRSLIEVLSTIEAQVLIEASLIAPWLRARLAPVGELDAESMRMLRQSLEALENACRARCSA